MIKKPHLLKSLKKAAAIKPKKKAREKSTQPKAKKGKVPDFSLDLGSPAKMENNQQSKQQADQQHSRHSEKNQAISEQPWWPGSECSSREKQAVSEQPWWPGSEWLSREKWATLELMRPISRKSRTSFSIPFIASGRDNQMGSIT